MQMMMYEFLMEVLVMYGMGEINTNKIRLIDWYVLYDEAEKSGYISNKRLTQAALDYIKENENGCV